MASRPAWTTEGDPSQMNTQVDKTSKSLSLWRLVGEADITQVSTPEIVFAGLSISGWG